MVRALVVILGILSLPTVILSAISGAGGWVPSCGIYLWLGEIRLTPITQNKPKDVVEMDIERAVQRVLSGEIVQIDARGGNIGRVRRRVLEAVNP